MAQGGSFAASVLIGSRSPSDYLVVTIQRKTWLTYTKPGAVVDLS